MDKILGWSELFDYNLYLRVLLLMIFAVMVVGLAFFNLARILLDSKFNAKTTANCALILALFFIFGAINPLVFNTIKQNVDKCQQ